MTYERTLKRIEQILFAAAIVLAFALVIGGAMEKNKAEMMREVAESNLRAAELRCENAEELARQYKEQYEEALFEIAELKEQIEQTSVTLDDPPADAYADLGWDFDYVVRVVGAEARGEPFDGILAVCQCIATTAEKRGITPEEVVKMPGRYASPVGRKVLDGMEDVNEACCQVFLCGERPFDEPIEYFYSTRGYSAWHENALDFCYEIGGHRYFKEAGA